MHSLLGCHAFSPRHCKAGRRGRNSACHTSGERTDLTGRRRHLLWSPKTAVTHGPVWPFPPLLCTSEGKKSNWRHAKKGKTSPKRLLWAVYFGSLSLLPDSHNQRVCHVIYKKWSTHSESPDLEGCALLVRRGPTSVGHWSIHAKSQDSPRSLL